jgi:hypothetical protein
MVRSRSRIVRLTRVKGRKRATLCSMVSATVGEPDILPALVARWRAVERARRVRRRDGASRALVLVAALGLRPGCGSVRRWDFVERIGRHVGLANMTCPSRLPGPCPYVLAGRIGEKQEPALPPRCPAEGLERGSSKPSLDVRVTRAKGTASRSGSLTSGINHFLYR